MGCLSLDLDFKPQAHLGIRARRLKLRLTARDGLSVFVSKPGKAVWKGAEKGCVIGLKVQGKCILLRKNRLL